MIPTKEDDQDTTIVMGFGSDTKNCLDWEPINVEPMFGVLLIQFLDIQIYCGIPFY